VYMQTCADAVKSITGGYAHCGSWNRHPRRKTSAKQPLSVADCTVRYNVDCKCMGKPLFLCN
jgi:hypothetical protein